MISFYNLPETATRDVAEADQRRIMAEDERVRIVYSRRWEQWQLVRRCGMLESYICLDGAYKIPGWFPIAVFEGERPNVPRMVEKMRSMDTWAHHANRKESIQRAMDDTLGDFDRRSKAESRAALDEAASSAEERFAQLGRYFGPREASV